MNRHNSVSMRIVRLAAASAAWLAAGVAHAKTWHVAPRELPGISADEQVRTLSEAAANVGPGDTVVIHEGIYRETVEIEAGGTAGRPIRFLAAPGAAVIITGADELAEWRKEAGEDLVFSTPWPHRFIPWNKSGTHPDDEFHRMIGRCEQVFIQNYPLLHIHERSKLSPGTFYVDLDAKRLYVMPRDNADLAKGAPQVEASARPLLWHVKGEHVHLKGLRFRYAANAAQHGAVRFSGAHGLIEDCVFEHANSSGAGFEASDLTVRRCVFQDNGQLGFHAFRAHNLLFTECLVQRNNVKGFDRNWEAGGNKVVLSRNVVMEKSRFLENRGHGIWFDIGNENAVVRQCLVADNEDSGIFYEISYSLNAHDNVIVGNGFAATPGAWGANAGIALSSSADCVIERNLVVGNREGLVFREQDRTTPLIGDEDERAIWTRDHRVRNNVLALNRDAQVWGWFDVADGRHWPRERQSPEERGAAARMDKRVKGAPADLSLEKLNIRFADNLLHAGPGQGLFHWGVPWRRHERYADPGGIPAEMNLDSGGRAGSPGFANIHARDFRVPAGSPAALGCYPKGEVPGVRLGILPEPEAESGAPDEKRR